MPYIGLPVFLRLDKSATPPTEKVCQCPTSGYQYFYGNMATLTLAQSRCQCPTSGYQYFYANDFINNLNKDLVSMPYIGLPVFLPLPSGNPVFSRVSRFNFAGNYQNILTISIFRLIFVLRQNLCTFASFSIAFSHHIVNYFLTTPN